MVSGTAPTGGDDAPRIWDWAMPIAKEGALRFFIESISILELNLLSALEDWVLYIRLAWLITAKPSSFSESRDALLRAISNSRSKRSSSGGRRSDFSERYLLIALPSAKRVVDRRAFSKALSFSNRMGSIYFERSRWRNQSSRKVASFLLAR